MNNVGFTFDEKVLKDYTIETFFESLPKNIDAIELAPDLSLLTKNTYISIAKYIEKNNQSLNFHVPYFVNKNYYDFTSDKNLIINHYTKLLSIIESLRQYSVKIPSLVLHGGTVLSNNKLSAKNDTLYMIDYLLNFIVKKNININLSFETLAKNSNMIGANRNEVINIISEFKTSNLKICWDLCHDYYNFESYELPNNIFLENVNYVHIHGKNNNIKHVSTKKFFDYNIFFDNYNFTQNINIELLKNSCNKSYYEDLENDINLISKL